MPAATDAEPQPVHLIPLREVMRRVGYQRTAVYALIKRGAFPRPVKAGVGKSSRWVLSEVERYIADAVAARDAPLPRTRKRSPRQRAA
jgi:prophage regulatory protein